MIDLDKKVQEIKRDTLKMVLKAKKGHLGGSFSSLEILVTLFYTGLMKYDPKNPKWKERDIFLLSKGHANNCLYVILADLGFFPKSELDTYSKNNSILGQHCDIIVPGIEFNSGSLGHGLGVASGIALSYKIDKKDNNVFVVIGDGECQEGSIWESALFASHHKLNNLIAFVDNNGLSAESYIKDNINLDSLEDKFSAFGWRVVTIDGHNISIIAKQICSHFSIKNDNKPLMIIANTIKCKGLLCLENTIKSHHTLPKCETCNFVKEKCYEKI